MAASDIAQNIFGEGEKVYYAEGNELKVGEVLEVTVDGDVKIASQFADNILTRHEKQVLALKSAAEED
ncbi:hypothetical protein [Streptomyces sp. MBT33]|uniref:hypothetical protein n=1 Tax=Streptomyces sp. MBT33 TaxID=1488363 RepID=UPI0019090B4F|nr:hypothetical protein [Streptomyces sp. MBT33]MBK3642964.1 hypothetical protein [Streptomyces sp. MBT33]